LALHAALDVADAAPRVEPLVEQTQLRLGRRNERGADGGAEEAGARVRSQPSGGGGRHAHAPA
jgi:hypothetical protein